MLSEGQVGIQILNDGDYQTVRMTKLAAIVAQQLHGRFYEQCYRNNLFTYGTVQSALAGVTNAIATTGASARPVIGVWNPLTSGVNLVVLQVSVNTTFVDNSAVPYGGLMYMVSYGNAAITTGANPVNVKALTSPGGSIARGYSINTSLTGMTNPLSILRCSGITSLNASGAATAAPVLPSITVDNIDGGILVPPGGVLALMTGTTPNTSIGVTTGIVWEEVPV